MNDARSRAFVPLLICLGLLAAQAGAAAQYDLRQRPEMTTTDDPRRIPIPARDISNDPVLVLRGGILIDGTGAQPVRDAVLVIQGNRILAAGSAAEIRLPAKIDRTVDVSGLYIVPGLIDLHMHFTQQRGDDFRQYHDSDAAAAIRGVEKLGWFLDGGITAVRDVGTRNDVALRLKEAVQRGILAGPRVFWSGKSIGIRSGHGDEITATASGLPTSLAGRPESKRVANGASDWRLAVREQIRMGADWIKLTAPYTREEVAAAIDEAHMHGIRVTADAFGDYITWAVEAGIDNIEHPLAVPDEALPMMAERGTALVPTLTAFYNPLTHGYPSAGIPPGGFHYTMSRRFYMSHEMHLETMRKARAAGVKVGIGTDIPFEGEKRHPDDYFTELGFFKEAGYTDEEILAAATRVGADILGMGDRIGTLEAGRLADVLVVSGNPLEDIRHLRSMQLVVADGRIVRDRLSDRRTDETASR
jgi:imidazolonepropionase-like amidohydrolase